MADAYVPYDGPVVTRSEALRNSIKRYFNGKPCSKGHLSERRTTTKACFACGADHLASLRKQTAERKAHEPLTSRMVAIAAGPSGIRPGSLVLKGTHRKETRAPERVVRVWRKRPNRHRLR